LPVITLVPYLIGPVLERLSCQRHRKLVFTAGILFTLTPLLFFKYSNYSINQLVIPLGISFYTFQSLAYLTSVYKRQTKPYLHFGLLALHIAFFTHLLAGPIVSPNDLIPQLRAPARVSKKLRDQGLRLISFGLFKKFAIANNLEVFGTTALAFPEKYAGFPLLLATILLLYRLYFDFSGYTDIAQGASLLFGIQLPRSFDNPFAARSISDFWRRWNITLVSWFREHVYFPLSRQWSSHFGIRAALVLTMILVGLWHAPTWPWLAFGVTNGVLLILDSHTGSFRTELAERLKLNSIPSVRTALSVVFTFLLLCIPAIMAHTPFNNEVLPNVWRILPFQSDYFNSAAFKDFFSTQQTPFFFSCLLALIIGVESLNFLISKNLEARWRNFPSALRTVFYSIALGIFVYFANMDKLSFYYFQF